MPAGDEGTLSRLYADLEAQLPRFGEAVELAEAGDQAAFDEIVQAAFGESEEADAAQRAYGFQVCGSEDEGEGDEDE